MSEPFRQQWHTLVEGQVYLSTGAGHISTGIFFQMDQEFLGVIKSSDAKLVHIINDTRYVLSIPPLTEMRKAKHPFHKRWAITSPSRPSETRSCARSSQSQPP